MPGRNNSGMTLVEEFHMFLLLLNFYYKIKPNQIWKLSLLMSLGGKCFERK